MWTYTVYILCRYIEKYPDKADAFKFKELADFIFEVLCKRHKLVLHKGKGDLYLDLVYLKKLGILDLEETESLEEIKVRVTDKQKLNEIARVVKKSPVITKVELFNEYLQRIDKAIEEAPLSVNKKNFQKGFFRN